MSKHAYVPRLNRDATDQNLARFFKVLGDANRLGIVLTIGSGNRSVSEIIDSTGLPQTLVSFHLKVLREARIVKTVRQGPFIFYSLAEPELLALLADLSTRLGVNARSTAGQSR
jgi:ArsR family transcriptional regulator